MARATLSVKDAIWVEVVYTHTSESQEKKLHNNNNICIYYTCSIYTAFVYTILAVRRCRLLSHRVSICLHAPHLRVGTVVCRVRGAAAHTRSPRDDYDKDYPFPISPTLLSTPPCTLFTVQPNLLARRTGPVRNKGSGRTQPVDDYNRQTVWIPGYMMDETEGERPLRLCRHDLSFAL